MFPQVPPCYVAGGESAIPRQVIAAPQPTSGKDPDMATVNASGASGARFDYFVSLMTDPWEDVPANYLFAYWAVTYWAVLYIGQCSSAKDRLPCHERWEEAARKGATHVLNHRASPDEATRKREEQDLIASHRPVLNVQHQPKTGLDLFAAAR
jgi:hypothetical protein